MHATGADRDGRSAEEGTEPEGAELAARLHSLAIHLLRHVRVEDRRTGLSPARLSALSVLVFGGPRTVGELAEAEQVTAPTMSRLVTALEEEELVRRAPDPDDGRSVIVRATERGTRLLEEGRDRRVERMAALLERLGERERARVRRACEHLEGALTDPDREPPGAPP